MNFSIKDHTFMICAYQENPYLEDCIQSVLKQKVLGNVKISTSTPNKYITGLAKKYNIPLVVNYGANKIFDNLNFAYSQADTALVTLCHQDDYYAPEYLVNVLKTANCCQYPIIIFTDYFEIRNDKIHNTNLVMFIKRMLNFPLCFSCFRTNKWLRRRILAFGCSICCPTVTFNKQQVPNRPFSNEYNGGSFDWAAWVSLSLQDGEFAFCPQKVLGHRIWQGSTSTEVIEKKFRDEDDYKILCSLWPNFLAKIMFALYRKIQKNSLEK